MRKSERFIFGVLLVALIVTIVEKTLDPWGHEEDEQPRDIHQERSLWVEPVAAIGTPSPSPEPIDFSY